jgi:hypothetical protein
MQHYADFGHGIEERGHFFPGPSYTALRVGLSGIQQFTKNRRKLFDTSVRQLRFHGQSFLR